MAFTLRTRFAKDIVTEFLPPSHPSRKAIVFCDGVPTVPSKKRLLEFFSKQGFWVFHPRYRGTWESGGRFLKHSPEKDIRDVVHGIFKPFQSLWNKKIYRFSPKKIYLFGSSFGGAGILLASRDPLVTKVVALSPVTNRLARGSKETVEFLHDRVKKAFGEAYRFSERDWQKLKHGNFYNPTAVLSEINGDKIFIIHAKDDNLVLWKSVKQFTDRAEAHILLLNRGGHFSLSDCIKPKFFKHIRKFLNSKGRSVKELK